MRKISAALKGQVFTPERRRRISEALKGKSPSLETRNKIAATLTGRKNSEHSAFMRARSLSEIGRDKVRQFQLGRTRSAETRAKMAAYQKANSWMRGRTAELNPNWIADRSQLKKNRQHMYDYAYKDWMRKVKNRDNWKCRIADANCSGRLEAHHILPWGDYPELRYEVNNGIALCRSHHPRGRKAEMQLSTFFQGLVAEIM